MSTPITVPPDAAVDRNEPRLVLQHIHPLAVASVGSTSEGVKPLALLAGAGADDKYSDGDWVAVSAGDRTARSEVSFAVLFS